MIIWTGNKSDALIIRAEVASPRHNREGETASAVLLFGVSTHIRSIGNLCLYFLLGVAIIGVCNKCDGHTFFRAVADLERFSTVVKLVL